MNYISVNNLNIKYNNKVLFNNISFNIQKGSMNSIVTPSSKGKTTLLNIISGRYPSENVKIDNKLLDNKIKSKIFYIDCYNSFFSKTIMQELLLVSNNILKIKKYLKEFNLLEFIKQSPNQLNYVQMQKLNIIKALLKKSEIILLDNIFSYFDNYSKIEFIGLLKKYQYEKNITIVYTTNNIQDTIFSDRIIIIEKDILYNGNIENIYLNDKLIKKSNLNIPLENELLEKLKLYNIIDNVTYTIDEVVNQICK